LIERSQKSGRVENDNLFVRLQIIAITAAMPDIQDLASLYDTQTPE
jgi:hypothetical protein